LILRVVEHSMDQCNKITNYMAAGTLLTSETFPGVIRTLNIISYLMAHDYKAYGDFQVSPK